MKKIIGIVLLMVLTVFLMGNTGCSYDAPNTSDNQQAKQQEEMMKDQINQVGLPDIKEWTEKKMAKEIYELRDNSKLITYAYMQNMSGKMVFLGQCIGFGLPYSTQYTSPTKMVEDVDLGDGWGIMQVPQPEPNGLYVAEGLSATWLQYINPDTGKREVIYCEPCIIVTQSKLPKRLCEEWSLPAGY